MSRSLEAAGAKTYSEVVNLALSELLRSRTFNRIDSFAKSDIWDGDLSAMRGDGDVPG
jgi:hypothetical protein